MDDVDLWADAPKPPWRAEDGSFVDPLLPPVMATTPASSRSAPTSPPSTVADAGSEDWPTWPVS